MSTLMDDEIERLTNEICAALAALPLTERVEAMNRVRRHLHEAGPFAGEPVDLVEWVPAAAVEGNDYNPNSVAPPEMRLLARSIQQDGYTQPIVTMAADGRRTVVDGYHRTRVGKENADVRGRVHGYLPVTSIRTGREGRKERIAATIRHNRARGVHGVLPMTEIVASLVREGCTDTEIARDLGMDADEVLRFKQNVGLPELFAAREYSKAWE